MNKGGVLRKRALGAHAVRMHSRAQCMRHVCSSHGMDSMPRVPTAGEKKVGGKGQRRALPWFWGEGEGFESCATSFPSGDRKQQRTQHHEDHSQRGPDPEHCSRKSETWRGPDRDGLPDPRAAGRRYGVASCRRARCWVAASHQTERRFSPRTRDGETLAGHPHPGRRVDTQPPSTIAGLANGS